MPESVFDQPPWLGPGLPVYPQLNEFCRVAGPSLAGSGSATLRGWSFGSSGTALTLAAPAGTLAGDQMLAFVVADTSQQDEGPLGGGAFVPDPTWTLIGEGDLIRPVGFFRGRQFCYTKTAGSGEGPSVWSDGCALIVLVVAVGGVVAPGSAPSQYTAPPAPAAPVVDVTPPAVVFVAFALASADIGTVTPPAGMTDSGAGTQTFLDVNGNVYGLEVSYGLVPPGAGVVGSGGVGQMTGMTAVLPVVPLALGAYPGYTGQLGGVSPPSLRDREPCYVFEPNGIPLAPGWYDCRLVGSFGGRPLYATACCPGGSSSSSSSG